MKIKIFLIGYLILLFSCNNSYNEFKNLDSLILSGMPYTKVETFVKDFSYFVTDLHKSDEVLFSIVIEGPLESSEQLYIDFSKDSVVVNKIFVH
jgi:hypothetical protein